jgi:hypothetical protein
VGLPERLREFIHHHAAVFTIGDLRHDRRQGAPRQRQAPEAVRLGAGLHLPHQLGVGALGFDQHGQAGHRAG